MGYLTCCFCVRNVFLLPRCKAVGKIRLCLLRDLLGARTGTVAARLWPWQGLRVRVGVRTDCSEEGRQSLGANGPTSAPALQLKIEIRSHGMQKRLGLLFLKELAFLEELCCTRLCSRSPLQYRSSRVSQPHSTVAAPFSPSGFNGTERITGSGCQHLGPRSPDCK